MQANYAMALGSALDVDVGRVDMVIHIFHHNDSCYMNKRSKAWGEKKKKKDDISPILS